MPGTTSSDASRPSNDPIWRGHPECVIADQAGEPLQIGGMYWPSVYSRFVWQYKVELGLEAARLVGFDEIQFDYMRFPDGTWAFEEGTIDYRNENDESKAQAVQRFLTVRLRPAPRRGVYVSADVFGECAEATSPPTASTGPPSAMWWTPSAPCPIRITTGPPGTGCRGSTPTRPCMPSARSCPATAGDGVSGGGTHVGAGLQRHPGATTPTARRR